MNSFSFFLSLQRFLDYEYKRLFLGKGKIAAASKETLTVDSIKIISEVLVHKPISRTGEVKVL